MIRRLQGIIIAAVLVVAAFSTGEPFLFYLLYLGILVLGGSYVAVRLGLTDLEAGYAVSQLSGHVGDQMRVTYTLRNGSRIPKPWLEVHNPTTLPGSLPGRAISLGGRSERSWLVRVPLTRRGHFRIEPLHIRTGDPFGFFEASATVGQGVSVIVYPKPGAAAGVAAAGRQPGREPRVAGADPPDDAPRHDGPAVRPGRQHEPDPLADDRAGMARSRSRSSSWSRPPTPGSSSTSSGASRPAVGRTPRPRSRSSAAASIAHKAIGENRAVGMTVNAARTAHLPADRGGRQHLKIMQLLAAVEADGTAPLIETLRGDGRPPRARHDRGRHHAVASTRSGSGRWRRCARAASRCVVVSLDPGGVRAVRPESAGRRCAPAEACPGHPPRAGRVRTAVLRRSRPGRPLGEVLARMIATARRPDRPEGWLSLGLVLLMCVTMAWAIDDVAPVMGRDRSPTSSCGPRSVASWSGSSGRRSAGSLADVPDRVGLRRAAGPVVVGGLLPDGGSPHGRLRGDRERRSRPTSSSSSTAAIHQRVRAPPVVSRAARLGAPRCSRRTPRSVIGARSTPWS